MSLSEMRSIPVTHTATKNTTGSSASAENCRSTWIERFAMLLQWFGMLTVCIRHRAVAAALRR